MATKKILLVDDTRLFLELEKSFLKLSPVKILTASNGEEALEIARKERPDLVFMDIHMPGMGGAACCGEMKSDPALRTIPVVMVTASGKEEDLEICRQAGCDGYVTKPIDRRRFLEKARSYLDAIDRREQRIPYRAPVICTLDGFSFTGTSEDLSLGGVYVASGTVPREKCELALEIRITGPASTTVKARGVVAWENGPGKRKKASLPPGFGVEFIGMQDSEGEIIRSFVESREETR